MNKALMEERAANNKARKFVKKQNEDAKKLYKNNKVR